MTVDWLPLALTAGALIRLFAYSSITLSTRLALVNKRHLIALLTVVIRTKVGSAGQLTVQPFYPGNLAAQYCRAGCGLWLSLVRRFPGSCHAG